VEEGFETSGFTLLPVCQVKRAYIRIDKTLMIAIIKRAVKTIKALPEPTPIPKWMRRALFLDRRNIKTGWKNIWQNFFNSSGLRSSRYQFLNVVTNGIGASAIFERAKDPAPPKLTDEEKAAAGLLRKAELRKAKRHIYIDPGRTRLITAMEDLGKGKKRWWVLTRRGYYGSFRHGTNLLEKLNRRVQHVDALFSETSLKANDAMFLAYCTVYKQYYGVLWEVRGGKRYARVSFYVASQKRRCLDSFFASFMYPSQKDYKDKTNRLPNQPVVWYGAGGFASHSFGSDGKGVPVKYVKLVCEKFYSMVLVGENLTSQMHSECKRRMRPVRTARVLDVETRKDTNDRTVRGLYYCDHCKKFVNRDRDACPSIKHVVESDERPDYLRRGAGGPKLPGKDLLPAKAG